LCHLFVNKGKEQQKQEDYIEEIKEIKETLKDYKKALDEPIRVFSLSQRYNKKK
jgi:hypothetical protein